MAPCDKISDIGLQFPWVDQSVWISHGTNNSQHGGLEMLINIGFYEVKGSQQVHYSFPNSCVHVCISILHFGEFPICWMYWTMESIMTLLLLWWLGCNCFVEFLLVFLQWQNLLWFVKLRAMFMWRQGFFGYSQCVVLFVEFNSCFTSLPKFWTPIAILSLLALICEVRIVC